MANGKQRRTFISYSRVNKEFAVKLARELRADGYFIFFDQLDIPTGSRWDDELEKALEECEVFLVIMTPAAIASENVKDEIGYAIDNRKRIMPVLLENCNVPLRLRRFQYVDFTTKNYDEGVESVKQLLTNLINEPTLPRIDVPSALQDKDAHPEAKAETERKAKQETDRLAAQKMEADRLAKQKAEREAKAEADRKAKAKVKPVQAIPSEVVSTGTIQKKPISRGLIIGIVAVVGLVIAGIGVNALSNRESPATEAPATEAPVVTDPATEIMVGENTATSAPVAATDEPATATSTSIPPTQAILSKFLKINFVKDTGMDVFDVAEIGLGENKVIDRTLSDDGLALTLNGSDLYLYYFYKPFDYQDVAVSIRIENLGTINRNNVSLLCRKNNDSWYEFSVASDGLWFLFDYNESNAKRYTLIGNGGSTAIKTGQNANEYKMTCIGNEISVYINGQKARTIKSDLYTEGQVGFNVSSLDLFPIEINVSEFEISKP